LQTEAGADSVLTRSLNVFGINYYQRANFVLNQSGSYTGLNNMFFYNSQKFNLYFQDEIITDLRDVGHYRVFPISSCTDDSVLLDFYVAHLKAGSSSSNQDRRAEECDSIRAYVDALPAGINNFLGGDFNFYDAAEQGYQTLTTGGTYPFNDPVSR